MFSYLFEKHLLRKGSDEVRSICSSLLMHSLAPQLPAVPVIDINKLPRYGVLAPPIERPAPQAGKMVDLDLDLDIFVKNRGILQEALVSKTGVFHHLKLHFTSQAGPA
jgi:hypothetical protein